MYACDVSRSLETVIGKGGLSQKTYEACLVRAAAAAARLKERHEVGNLLLTQLPDARADLKPMQGFIDRLCENTTDLVVLGIGGSSLGAQTLAQLSGWGTVGYRTSVGRPTVHMPENLDARSFEQLLEGCDLRTTRFLVVSKSGATAEPLSQMLRAMTAIESAGGGKYLSAHFAVLTGPEKTNPLRVFAQEHGFSILEHGDVGGRYSVLSTTGLAPALVMGVDPVALRMGAQATLTATLSDPEAPVVACAAITVGLLEERAISLNVLTAYEDRLQRMGLWFRQLWGESLGKDGKGLTPLVGVGAVDQHSQLQLFLDGPNDKLHTIITRDVGGEGLVPDPTFTKAAFSLFSGKTIGDLLAAEQRATIETLAKNGRPVCELRLPALKEENLGALLMHFMLEAILVADLIGVDPFDQPAVEEGKELARSYLSGRT